MPDPHSQLDLETKLHQLTAMLTWPPTPDVAATVTAQLETARLETARLEAGERRRPRVAPTRWSYRTPAVVAVVVVVLAATLMISPRARRAAADLLGLRSVHITTGPVPTLPRPTAVTRPLDLGPALTLSQAGRKAGFDVRLPTLAPFDHPDAIYVVPPPPEGEVALAYQPRADLPGAAQTGVGLLLTEFPAQLEAGFFAKVAGPDTTIEALTLRGQPAYWLAGAPHALFYRDAKGDIFADTLRLATNTLVWDSGALTVRIEGNISKSRALEIANSIP